MKRRDAVQVAVVGHTNTGKTSLLRTLARDRGFGEVSDRPATTRGVSAIELLAEDEAVLRCFDTPGLEDAVDLAAYLAPESGVTDDPVARIEAFVAGDHDAGRFEQEAKVLRQMLRVDAALYVIDVREPVLAKHRAELRLLADCGRPLLPVLNFVADSAADPARWRAQLARSGLHVLAEFDTVVFDLDAETRLFEQLGALLDTQRPRLARLTAFRAGQRRAQIDDACHAIAQLLVDAAGARRRLAAGADIAAADQALREQLLGAEQACVDRLLDIFAFELGAYRPPELPLREGRWVLDPFDPESARVLGIRTGSAAAAGGVAGFGVDAVTGGLSLGAATLIGAGVGALIGVGDDVGRDWIDRLRGRQRLAVEATTLAVLATRQRQLLLALLRRGHASQDAISPEAAKGWPSEELRRAVLRARAHPEWSRLNGLPADPGGAERNAARIATILESTLPRIET